MARALFKGMNPFKGGALPRSFHRKVHASRAQGLRLRQSRPLQMGCFMLIDADESQLVLVDFQARLKPAMLDADAVWANAAKLATLAKALALPIWVKIMNAAASEGG